ncbi:hypothetical protein M9Y10_024577 [Tritrichomonas musculus]|uniref:Right handed beta helix domain-containing protein n=1 Tax=Tritrichomonas musculus TaxID=1915356 RepID=A0ABR2HCD0_9EUKA
MMFLLYLAIVQCKKALADPIPTPQVYPLSVSTRLMKITGDYSCYPKDPDCPTSNFDQPSTYKCGQICWSDNGNAEFTYTFKGVQFLVYGNKDSKTTSFELYLDNNRIATIDEKLKEGENAENYTLLYTSNVIDYKEHTVKAKGIKDNPFSLFKFAYWPHLKARRLNITEMKYTGSWTEESDEIGGMRAYSNKQKGASRSLTIEASKLWVYGTVDDQHGKLRISFNTLDEIIETRQPREDHKLMFESELLPSTFHQLDLVAVEDRPVLIYVVYYLYDPPQPTPMAHPSRSPHPGAIDKYINKEYIGVDVPQITDAETKQVSGCTFKDIKSNPYFVRLNKDEMLYYNNRVEFTTASTENPAPVFIAQSYKGQKMTISQCTFINCVSRDGDGNVINCRVDVALTIEGSRFVNCIVEKMTKPPGVIKFNEETPKGSLKLHDCIFQFSVDTLSCPALYGNCPDATIESCTFSKCCAANLTGAVSNFKFANNIVTYSAHQGIIMKSLTGSCNISGNSFKFNKVTTASYIELGSTNDNSKLLVSKNTFTNCKANGFVIQVSAKQPEIENCEFVFDANDARTACGAIQSTGKGFSCKFCTFTKTFARGAITVTQTDAQTDPVTVSNCIFDDCGGDNIRCFSFTTYTTSFTFSNNVVQNMKATGGSGYFGQFMPNRKVNTLVLKNITFKDNACNSQYGGGTGLWIVKLNEVSFEDCKFINNLVTSSNRDTTPTGMTERYKSGDGGAFQYGFTNTVYEINLKFENCLFSRNKAVRHGGALALQTVGTVVINKCTFEENVANFKASSAELLENHFTKKAEGRGGAIYINPVFEYGGHDHKTKYMKSVTITGCTFKSNSAFDGFAIYIEGDDPGTTFTIKDNSFISNSDGTSNSEKRAVILSEIESLCTNGIDPSNTFNNPVGISINSLLCVDHFARTPSPSPMPTLQNATISNEECTDRCEVIKNKDTVEFPSFYEIIEHNAENKNDSKKGDGGAAVHLENVGVSIVKSSFKSCTSEKSGGGAIYIDNVVNLGNIINIENTDFEGCSSAYGGAVYIRSISEFCPVSIINCNFKGNTATRTQSPDNLFGGSALFTLRYKSSTL